MTCTEADIVTTALLAWSEELSQELASLVKRKDAFLLQRSIYEANAEASWLKFAREMHTMRLKAESADMKIRQIVNYKILDWDARAQAYEKLSKEMIESWENAWTTISLLKMVDDADVKDYWDIAKYFMKDGEDPATAINRIRKNIANTWASLYEQEKYVKNLNINKVDNEWKATKEDVDDAVEKTKADEYLIKKGLNPSNFSHPDAEWTVIKHTVEWEENQWKRWTQYCISKAIVWWVNTSILKKINSIIGAKNIVWKLDAKQIDNITELDELIARAYTNPEDLINDWLVRDAFNNKLTELLANVDITKAEEKYARRLIKVARFSKEWAWFSKIVMYDAVAEQARKMGIKVNNAENFYDNIMATVRKENFIEDMTGDWMIKMANGWTIAPNNLLELIVVATWDTRIPKLLRDGSFTSTSLLDVATQVALGEGKKAAETILKIINKVKEMPTLANSKDLALMTLCWQKINAWAKKGFFNYRAMYNKGNVTPETMKKALFEERMANTNRAEISVDWLENLTNRQDLVTHLKNNYAWGYIITNDSWYMHNKDFIKALDLANKDLKPEEQITVLYPKQALMSNFTFDNGKLIFRSRDNKAFRDLMDKVSLRTLWDADATRIQRSLAYEIVNWVSWDKIKYWVTNYKGLKDNLWNGLSDQQWEFLIDTKVRDWDWNIIKVYHSTSAEFKEFDINKARKNTDVQWLFFSSNLKDSQEYGPITMECYLSITNPAPENVATAILNMHKRAWVNNAWELTRLDLQRLWYDWIVRDWWEYVVFDSSQIISVANKNPSIKTPKIFHNYQDSLEDYIIGVWMWEEFLKLAEKIDEEWKYKLLKDATWHWALRDTNDMIIRNVDSITELKKLFSDYWFDSSKMWALDEYYKQLWFSTTTDYEEDSIQEFFKVLLDWGIDVLKKDKDLKWYVEVIEEYLSKDQAPRVSDETIEWIRQWLKEEYWRYAINIQRDSEWKINIVFADEEAENSFDFAKYNTNDIEWIRNLADKYWVELKFKEWFWAGDLWYIWFLLDDVNQNKVKAIASRLWIELKPKDITSNAYQNLLKINKNLLTKDEYFDAVNEYIKREIKDSNLIDNLVVKDDWLIDLDKSLANLRDKWWLVNKLQVIDDIAAYVWWWSYFDRFFGVLDWKLDKSSKEYKLFFWWTEESNKLNMGTLRSLASKLHWWANNNRNIPTSMWVWMKFDDFMKNVFNDRSNYLPYEIWVWVDKDWIITWVVVWNATSVPRAYKTLTKDTVAFYHNHPNWSYFSWFDWDYWAFKHWMKDSDYPNIKKLWVMLPWWWTVVFEWKRWWQKIARESYLYSNRQIDWKRPSWATEGILYLVRFMKQLKQDTPHWWWVFQEVVDEYMKTPSLNMSDDLQKKFYEIWEKNDAEQIDRIIEYLRNDQWEIAFQEWSKQLDLEKDLAITDALKVELFWDWRTVEDIAKAYNIPIEILHDTNLINWVKAYGSYWDGVIKFTDMVKESTAPHELFHAVFDIVDEKTRFNIIEDSKKLFWYTDREANEALADAFSEWFRTWKFKYADSKVMTEAEKTSFYDKVKQFFNEVLEWLWLIDMHRADVEKLFNDMVNIEYLKNDWKTVSKAEALWKYTEDVEKSANSYFAAMLWETDWANPEFRDVLHAKLEDMTWIPIKSLRDLASVDKNKLWQAVDTEFTNAQRTTWLFKTEITDVTERINAIESLDVNWMKDELKSILNGMITDSAINDWNLNLLKQALEDYEVASTIEEWMEAKGRLLAMANGWNAEVFTLKQLKDIFTNGTQAQEFKEMFFPNQNLTDKELKKYINWIDDMIFDWLTISLTNNLVKMWYSIPLDSARWVVLDYLTSNINLSDNFAKTFLYKNWFPESKSMFESIIDSAMPMDLKLGYEDAMYKLRDSKPTWIVNRIVKQDNPFLPDNYSSLASLINARTWTAGITSEEDYLWRILDKYKNSITEKLKKWIDFEEAQQLKTQIWYALDIFEQDIVMSKYWQFLTPEQKASIRNMKSYLPIIVWKEWDTWMWSQISNLNDMIDDIKSSFSKWLKDVVWKYSILRTTLAKWDEKAIKELENKMKEKGTVMWEHNWEIIIIDARTNIKNLLKNLPDSIKWFWWIEALIQWWLDWLDNQTAYFLNQLIESAKKLDALAKWEPAMMYHMDPQLNMVRFFENFKLVDFWPWEKIPAALTWNILAWNKNLSKYDLSWVDEQMKIDIFKKVKWTFELEWNINIKKLKEIINTVIEEKNSILRDAFKTNKPNELEELKKNIFAQYQKAFIPYTHLRDIPSWFIEYEWWALVGAKQKINDILSNEVWKIREALSWLPETYANSLNNISITTPTWEVITVRQFLDWMSPNWKKAIFDDENIMVKSMDELDWPSRPTNSTEKERVEWENENKKYKKRVISQYNEVLQSIQNQQQVISEAERKLSARMLNNARNVAQKYSLTNRLVEASNMVWWLEEQAARMVKYWLLWFWNNLSFWAFNKSKVMNRLRETQEAYRKYYTMALDDMNNIAPTNEAEELAQHLCRYFKTLENYLGSADWVTWVTTRANINKAFYNIWEVFMNVDSIKWIYAMMSAIEENQLLKFFRFSMPWQASYVKEFTKPATATAEDIIWGYREYVSKIPDNINRDSFNDIFAANFSEVEFKSLYQALTWLTYVWEYWKNFSRFFNFVNGTSFIWRFLVSYPWQIFTIPQQGIAYFLKQIWFQNQLWEYNLWEIDRIRSKYWTLDKAYNEINFLRNANPDNINLDSYYNRYWVPDINDVYKKASITTADDVNDMYAKIANYQSTWDNTGKLMRSIDAYKDNANNIIDWLFARNFKNIAFLKGIRDNAFMQFWSAQAFEEFMMDNTISRQVKKQLMDAVNAASWRNFRNILWLWFGWLDRAIGWHAWSNITYWLMQMFNFRWAWWQNIFKQTWEAIMWAALMAKQWISPWGKDAIALYLSRTPEFSNLFYTLLNDMKWTWKLQRYQDNGRWSELEDEYDIVDFLEYSKELLSMTSQWYQWIQSFWPARPVMEWADSIGDSLRNPEVYKDTLWLWAFFNALGKNAWRNWKPRNWFFQAIQAFEEWWEDWFWAYFHNQFWKLSFGSLRYMMDEDTNKYWYTYDIINDEWWIPSIFRWETAIGSDKTYSYALSNANTWNALKEWFNDENLWEDRKTYLWDVWWAIINSSNLINTWKNFLKILPEKWRELVWVWNRIQPFTMESFTDTIAWTEAWIELIKTWKVVPRTELELKSFVEEYVDAWDKSSMRSNLKPFGSKFAKAINNFNLFWHVDWDDWDTRDKELEFLLTQIRYERDENWNIKKEKKETQLWKDLVEYIHSNPTDMDSTSIDVSQMVYEWIEENNDDPNYLLYQSLVWQWMVDYYLDASWDSFMNDWNKKYWGKKADTKLSKQDALESWWYWQDFMTYLLNSNVAWMDNMSLIEYLQNLDRNASMRASIKIIKNQMIDDYDRKALEKYVTFEKDKYGNEYVNINNQYMAQLQAIGWLWDAIDRWDVDLLIARASQYANTYINTSEDPTGLNTAKTILSLSERVRNADIAPNLKVKMLSALAENNIEFMQHNIEVLRKVLWKEDADKLLAAWNELIYWIDWSVNSVIWQALMNWDWDAAKAGSNLSKYLKNVMSKYTSPTSKAWASWNWYWGRWDTTWDFVPYTLDIAKLLDATWGKGYSPKDVEINIRKFQPTVDFSIGKDEKRWKKVFNTQKVDKKKVVL